MGATLFIISFIIILIARFINIYFLAYLLNKYRSKNIINHKHKFFLWFSGLRGAMAFALALNCSERFKEG